MTDMSTAAGFARPLTQIPVRPVAPTRPAADEALTARGDQTGTARRDEAEAARAVERAKLLTAAMTPAQPMRVEVEWHAASLSYVHRVLSQRTGEQVAQFPAAQVLDLVDDLMKQIAEG